MASVVLWRSRARTEDQLPHEETWTWEGLAVHLDRYKTANNKAVTVIVRRDRLGGGRILPARFLRTWMHYVPQREPHAVTLPILLAHPGDDRWTPTELSERFFNKLNAPKRMVTLDNCGHFPLEEPGLTQLETAVREFAAEVIG